MAVDEVAAGLPGLGMAAIMAVRIIGAPEAIVSGSVTAEVNVEDELHVAERTVKFTRARADSEVRRAPGGRLGRSGHNVHGDGVGRPAPDLDGSLCPLNSVDTTGIVAPLAAVFIHTTSLVIKLVPFDPAVGGCPGA